MFRALLWNQHEGRIRAPWRFVIFLAVVAIVANPLVLVLDQTGNALLESTLVNPIVALACAVALWFSARYTDRRPLRDFGLTPSAAWGRDLVIGFAIGAVIVSAIFAVEWLAGWVEIRDIRSTDLTPVPFAVAFLGQLVRYAGGSFFEELISRSYLLRLVAEGAVGPLGRKPAVVLAWVATSVGFGVLHLFNPNATWLGALNVALLGMLFGFGMVYTGRLALPIGLHMAWNVFQNNIYGLPNSGKPSTTSLLVTETNGPASWTGGAFGPEGGLLAVGAIALGWGLVWLWLRAVDGHPALRQGLAEPPAR